MKQSLLLFGALALATLVASAKSYDITLSAPAVAGNVALKAGHYSVKVDGANAVFTSVETTKSFTAPVKIEQAAKKFDNTAVDTTTRDGADRIQSIELGGSTTVLEFGE